MILSLSLALCLWSSFHSKTDAWSIQQRSLNKRYIRFQSSTTRLFGGPTDDNNNNNKIDASSPSSLPTIHLYNSKSRSKEPLRPLQSNNKVSMYTCGPTVYDYAHVGNFRAFLTYDLIKRVLLYFGYDVTHVCNLTDVDDKIINRANEQKYDNIQDLTRKYEAFFFQDLQALNVLLADHYPRATEHIDEMMDMILELASKDLAYETQDGSWYFATANKEGYGEQLVQLNVDDMETTERGESELKRDPQDFALWKAFKPEVDREDSSWERPGKIKKGRPGWHLECSAMARKYLGDTIDIHGGGVDLKFPHHENEIAQSEGVTGTTFCNCWLHNGFVNINDEKMSKSLGNFLTLRGACPQSKDVRAYRFLVMSSQYSKPLSFTPDAMGAAKNSLKRIDKVMAQIETALSESNQQQQQQQQQQHNMNDESVTNSSSSSIVQQGVVPKAMEQFEMALLDDLSMPRASASLFSLIKAAEKELKRGTAVASSSSSPTDNKVPLDLVGLLSIATALRRMDTVFGIFYNVPLTEEEEQQQQAAAAAAIEQTDDASPIETVPEEVMVLVTQRTEAKQAKDWDLADSLRTRIAELGFVVKDVKGGDPVVTRSES
ncbi:cysteinyl-tRNA synthetase [Nitzschia inconspicua]|uniref:Cysteine--tRNA ligase n=1 Tax=Nitzschia inconspicua TaxID=303405 RepID=A0A9K3KJM4_9STRA|nr:cysteinyl-tRNA synthetase [Nitzschia inconspicua]